MVVETQKSILNDFLDIDDWAETVYINGEDIKAIVDREVLIDEAVGRPIYSRNPTLHVRDKDVDNVELGDEVVVRDVNYKVTGYEPDGTGMTIIRIKVIDDS